MATARKIRLVR